METKYVDPANNSKNKKEDKSAANKKAAAMAAGAAVVAGGGVAAAATIMNKKRDEAENNEDVKEEGTATDSHASSSRPVVEKVNEEPKSSNSNSHKNEDSHNDNPSGKPEAPAPKEHNEEQPTNNGGEDSTNNGGEGPTNNGGGEQPITPPAPSGEEEIISTIEVDPTDTNPEGFFTFHEVESVAQIDGTESTYATFTTESSDTEYAMIDLDNDGVFDVIVDENGNQYTDDVTDVMVSDAQYMINSDNNEYLAQTEQEGGDVSITGESFTDDTITV